jgi:hypothetical protein
MQAQPNFERLIRALTGEAGTQGKKTATLPGESFTECMSARIKKA